MTAAVFPTILDCMHNRRAGGEEILPAPPPQSEELGPPPGPMRPLPAPPPPQRMRRSLRLALASAESRTFLPELSQEYWHVAASAGVLRVYDSAAIGGDYFELTVNGYLLMAATSAITIYNAGAGTAVVVVTRFSGAQFAYRSGGP